MEPYNFYNYHLYLYKAKLNEFMNTDNYNSFANLYYNLTSIINEPYITFNGNTKSDLTELLLELQYYYIESVTNLTK